ncbi:hypothetical protein ES044_16060 [Polaribacter sp. IC066]|jgi:hypothetical protein|uniref:hypothetical protein n=1 Tax=Polaribacter sp. IC066 TaxID=57032 RepID=UPI0011BF018F|nr:hypothetical protein [Polaribacter sp. IC066]TXD56907.1 hypothetical protein ES044_16060 [Polaribacter sp. IC066]
MSYLKDYFPDAYDGANKITYTSLDKGTVLRMFVNDTTPPKTKIFIVLGLHDNKVALGTLFINSKINDTINFSVELQALQYKLYLSDYAFLDKDSFVDCSNIQQRDNKNILQKINEDNSLVVGRLNQDTFEDVRKAIISAETIRGKHKKRFGLYDV